VVTPSTNSTFWYQVHLTYPLVEGDSMIGPYALAPFQGTEVKVTERFIVVREEEKKVVVAME
jgi:hypothetical protein